MAEQTPKRGEQIIEIQKDSVGGNKLIASIQFQKFLESLGVETLADNALQAIGSLSARVGMLFGRINRLHDAIEDIEQIIASINTNKFRSMILDLARKSLEFFVAAGYGSVSLTTPTSMGTVTVFETVPFDTDVLTTPRGVTQDQANDGLRFNAKGIWSISVILSLSHDEINAGREFDFRTFNDTQSLAGLVIPIGIGRNVGVTTFAGTFLVEILGPAVGDLFVLQIGNGDTLLTTTMEYAGFSVNHVSELQEEFT